jgi:hypothetical protein
VSYALAVAPDATADLRRLEPWLQEETLDELELVLTDPSILPALSLDKHASYTFSREASGVEHNVTMIFTRNDTSKTLALLGVDDKQRPAPP